MALTIREQLLAAIAAKLATITVANGYATDVQAVQRLLSDPIGMGVPVPCLILHDVDEQERDAAPTDLAPVGFHLRRLGIVIESWVRQKADGTLSTELNALLGDVITAMEVDPQWSGLAVDTHLGPTLTILAEKDEPLGSIQLRFEIDYRFVWNNPTVG